MKQTTLLTALILTCSVNYAQIITDKKVESKSKTVKPVKSDSTWNTVGQSWLFLGIGYQLPTSVVKPTNSAFGKPLGMRADEKMENRATYQLGIRSHVNQYLTIEAGFQVDRYAQSYHFDHPTTDSMYNYVRDYTFIGIPIQALFTTGNRLKFYVGIGAQPMITMRNHLVTNWADSLGNKFDNTVNKKETMNFLNLSVMGSLGLSFQINDFIGVYFMPTYSLGVTSIYGKQAPHQEWLKGLNFKLGLAFNTKNFTGPTRKKKV